MFHPHWSDSVHHDGSPRYVVTRKDSSGTGVTLRLRAGLDAPIEHVFLRYWLRPPFRADGWRIDVANMLARQGESQLGHKIGRGIRRAVKAESPTPICWAKTSLTPPRTFKEMNSMPV